jgi:hypothetical protein
VWETVLKPPYLHLVEPEASAQLTSPSGYNRCSASLSAPERSQDAPQPLIAPLWFELPDFALQIIDAGLRTIQPSLKIFYFLAELLKLRIHFLQIL